MRRPEGSAAARDDCEVQAPIAKQENIIRPSTQDAALQFFKLEQDRCARLFRKAGITID
jgi:hypothetical protein